LVDGHAFALLIVRDEAPESIGSLPIFWLVMIMGYGPAAAAARVPARRVTIAALLRFSLVF